MDFRRYLIKRALQNPAPVKGAGNAIQASSSITAPWYLGPVNSGDKLRKFLKQLKISKAG